MWRCEKVLNYKLDDADQSPITNTISPLFKKLPNDLVPYVPYWAYTLHMQLKYTQMGDGIPVQGMTYHVAASVAVPVRETRVADLDISYQFEDSESEDGDDEEGRKTNRLSDRQLQRQVLQKLRQNVKDVCTTDGIGFQDVPNFELGYLRFLYTNNRLAEVETLCKNVSREPLFKGNVHPVRRYLAEICKQIEQTIAEDRAEEQRVQLLKAFLKAFYKANPSLLEQIPALEELSVDQQKRRLQEVMNAEYYQIFERRITDYIEQQTKKK